jgi:hypothetical protein
MATTPGRKVRDGKQKDNHVSMETDPPYYGDPETLKSGSARADSIPRRNYASAVEGGAAQPDMTRDFVAGHDGWPTKVEG